MVNPGLITGPRQSREAPSRIVPVVGAGRDDLPNPAVRQTGSMLFFFVRADAGLQASDALLARRGGDRLDLFLLRLLGFPIASLLALGHGGLPLGLIGC